MFERLRRRNNIARDTSYTDETGSGYNYLTGLVSEYISEPKDYLDRKVEDVNMISSLLSEISEDVLAEITVRDILVKKSKEYEFNNVDYLSNPEDAEVMPKNSIIAYIIDDARSRNGLKPFICYPFFPSHISLPVKPGEHVWIVKHENYGRDVYYWMCRKPGIIQTEDTN